MSKKSLGLLTIAMAMGGVFDTGGFGGNNNQRYTEPKETEEQRKRRLASEERKQAMIKGLKEFFYGDNVVYAINQKTADKKAKKKGYI